MPTNGLHLINAYMDAECSAIQLASDLTCTSMVQMVSLLI